MKLIQITDTHIPPCGERIYGVDADVCVITGDLVNHGSAAEYANLKGALDRLELPLRLLVGNHDDRALLCQFFPDTPVDGDGHVQSVIDAHEGRFLLLDTLDPGKSSGVLCERRLAWMARQMSERADVPLYVFLHHPPLAVGIEYMDEIGLRNAEDLWRHIEPHAARVRFMAFGHLHRPVSGLWRGIPFAGCPSIVHQVALELGAQSERHLNFNLEPPCYAIFQIASDTWVAHQQRFTENWNTFPRQGAPSR
jgi:Icc protein